MGWLAGETHEPDHDRPHHRRGPRARQQHGAVRSQGGSRCDDKAAEQAWADAIVAELQALGCMAAALPLEVADKQSYSAFAVTLLSTLAQTIDTDRIDALVNTPGIGVYAPFEQTSEVQLDELYRVHLEVPFLVTQAMLPLLADGAASSTCRRGSRGSRCRPQGVGGRARAPSGCSRATRHRSRQAVASPSTSSHRARPRRTSRGPRYTNARSAST